MKPPARNKGSQWVLFLLLALALLIVSGGTRYDRGAAPVLRAMPRPQASVRTYESGPLLYLDNGTVRVGLALGWGGAIVEVTRNGKNFVNAFDPGREIQIALYDGSPFPPCGNCQGAEGWDPVQAGDWHRHGSPLVAKRIGSNYLYTRTQPIQWYPDNKGGGASNPVSTDAVIEQTISFVPDSPFTVQVHFKITHTGTDIHTVRRQEVPCVYENGEFNHLIYYSGTNPWTNERVTDIVPPRGEATPWYYTPENWAAYVNSQGEGLAVYIPAAYPYIQAKGTGAIPASQVTTHETNYFEPLTSMSFSPGTQYEGDYYILVGTMAEIRPEIYALHRSVPVKDCFAPQGYLDLPAPNATLKGTARVAGWAYDNVAMAQVEILLDGKLLGTATYGSARADIAKSTPHAPSNVGFQFEFDSTKYANGTHTLSVHAVDTSGNVAILREGPVVLNNPAPNAKP